MKKDKRFSLRLRTYYLLIIAIVVIISFGAVVGALTALQQLGVIGHINVSTLVALLLVAAAASGSASFLVGRRVLAPMVKTSFGLYIGDDIKLYYDTNEDLPTEVWRTDLALDAASGEEFVDLFHHDTFSRQRIESLCHAQAHTIMTRQAMADFRQSLETDPDDTIRRVLTDYFVLQKRCDPDIVEEALNRLHFSTQTDGTGDKGHATPLAQSAEYSCPAIHQAKHKRDTTKYSLDEGKHFFGKGKFVREVVAKYMEENPGLTYEQLTQIFFPKLQGTSLGVLRTLQSIDSLDQKKKKDLSRRYVLAEGLTLTSADGTTFAVCTQWDAKNFLNILALLNKWGWNIVGNHARETNP